MTAAKKPTGTAPELTSPLQPVTSMEGNPVKLECQVKGEPQPDIEWFKDGKPVVESKRVIMTSDGETFSLSFKPVELDDEGEYKCVARNELGSVSSGAELLVEEAGTRPEFKEKLKNTSAMPGEEVRFDVRVAGSPPPEVDWFKGKERVNDEGRFLLVDDEEDGLFSLIIEDVGQKDSGTYKCVAFNEVGEASCSCELLVEETIVTPEAAESAESAPDGFQEAFTAPEFVEGAENAPLAFEEGEDVTLNAIVKGQPAPDVEWLKDDKSLKSSDHLDIVGTGGKHSLTIRGASSADSGTYMCQARNKGGVTDRTFVVQVTGLCFFIIYYRFT